MNNRSGILFCITGAFALALSVFAFAAAQEDPQGQYSLSYSPVTLSSADSTRTVATYSPIKSINGRTIQLRGEDGVVYTFTLTTDTIYCQDTTKVSDWSYLKNVPKKSSVTVLTEEGTNPAALVVWDKAPTISIKNGQIDFSLPPLCR
ncbi:MAG: hypothetical protein WB424_19035 [Terracidiphilus sp.]|jgi:hypothetical protein